MKIRNAKGSDVKELSKLFNSIKEFQSGINRDFYTKQWIESTIRDKKRNLSIVAEENKNIIGFLLAEIWKGKQDSFLLTIFIKSPHRKKGVASELMSHYEKFCKKLNIESISMVIQTSNKKMQSFIEKRNYKKGKTCYIYTKTFKLS